MYVTAFRWCVLDILVAMTKYADAFTRVVKTKSFEFENERAAFDLPTHPDKRMRYRSQAPSSSPSPCSQPGIDSSIPFRSSCVTAREMTPIRLNLRVPHPTTLASISINKQLDIDETYRPLRAFASNSSPADLISITNVLSSDGSIACAHNNGMPYKQQST